MKKLKAVKKNYYDFIKIHHHLSTWRKTNRRKNSREISHIAQDVILKDEIKTLVRRSGQKTKKGKENFNICSHSEIWNQVLTKKM
jgi:hypothetical protein